MGEEIKIGLLGVEVEDDSVTVTVMSGDGVEFTVSRCGGYEAESLDDVIDQMVEQASGYLRAQIGRQNAIKDADEDEGLREGACFTPGASYTDTPPSPCKTAAEAIAANDWNFFKSDRHWKAETITIPNSEYADLLEAKRRAETSLAACRAALQSVPEVGAVTLKDGSVVHVRVESYAALEAIWDALGNFPYERPVTARFDDPTGETSLEDFVAATTAGVSDSDEADGGPVEPELDIDALVADADAERDTCSIDIRASRNVEHPVLTVTVTGKGSADLVRQVISDIYLPDFAKPLEDSVTPAARTVNINVGGKAFKASAINPVEDLRKSLACAQRAGGIR